MNNSPLQLLWNSLMFRYYRLAIFCPQSDFHNYDRKWNSEIGLQTFLKAYQSFMISAENSVSLLSRWRGCRGGTFFSSATATAARRAAENFILWFFGFFKLLSRFWWWTVEKGRFYGTILCLRRFQVRRRAPAETLTARCMSAVCGELIPSVSRCCFISSIMKTLWVRFVHKSAETLRKINNILFKQQTNIVTRRRRLAKFDTFLSLEKNYSLPV